RTRPPIDSAHSKDGLCRTMSYSSEVYFLESGGVCASQPGTMQFLQKPRNAPLLRPKAFLMDTPKSLNKPLRKVGVVFGAALSIAMALTSACGPIPCEKTLTCPIEDDDSSTGGKGMGGDGDGDGDMGGARGDGDGDGDECQEDETQEGSTECGFNDRGALQEVCVDGQWKEGSTCLDPDECQDDETQNGSVSCGDDGVVIELCEEGEWTKTSDCNEEIECTGDAEQAGETSCGLNGRGQMTQ